MGRKRSNTDVGSAVRDMRTRKHILQKELSAASGLPPAQICNIESGKISPTVRTLDRIAQAMGTTLKEIIELSPYISPDAMAARAEARPKVHSARATHFDPASPAIPQALTIQLDALIHNYMEMEDAAGVSKRCLLPLRTSFIVNEEGSEYLAGVVRHHCNVGTAIVFDAVELFENQGVRILFTDLPKEFESLSFYDTENENFFIFIANRDLTAERQQFLIAAEIANAFLFVENGCQPFPESDARRRFAHHFAATFLMPSSAVLASAMQLNVGPRDWTFPLVLRLKARFGVSAESFICRLGELKLANRNVVDKLLAEAKASYKKTGAEPQPEGGIALRMLSQNGRYNDLATRLKRPLI